SLSPADLLVISRVNKQIRQHMQGPDSVKLWQLARKNEEGLPECPEWLTETQYAALCFGNHCQNCLNSDDRSRSPIWQFYARYCSECERAR
ncbi:hypothetical protein C8Q76DRAFT_623693, partial [Earliella scabrosa]